MSRRAAVTLGCIVLLTIGVAGVWSVFFRGQTRAVRSVVVERRPELSATVRATGKVDVTGRLAVPLTQAGAVRLLAVRVGDVVRAGDVLAALDDGRQRQDVQAASDTLDAAQYALTAARARGGADLTNRSAIVTAEATLQDAQRRLETARDALRRTLIVAPTDGTVLSVAVAERGVYNQGQELLQLASLTNLVLTVDIDELDVPRLGDNRAARVLFDAFPGQEVQGTLTAVAPLATNRNGRTIYEGTVIFSRPPNLDLRPGMGADVTVATRTERNVLVVPDLAIETIGSKTFVTVIKGDGTRDRVEVRTGIRANGLVVIASGVNEGARVALP
jgi:RND family efflux transporter MFP subunit